MAKNNFCYPSLLEEESISHHFHATASRSTQLQEMPTNYVLEYQEPFQIKRSAELEDKSAADSSHNHRQAEKRRRDRINAQLARLRRLIPKSEKGQANTQTFSGKTGQNKTKQKLCYSEEKAKVPEFLCHCSKRMDKAALLESVVEQVKDLKRKALELSKFVTIPTEIDDITIECHTNNMQEAFPTNARDHKENHPYNKNNNNNDNNIMLMKATFCCEDRPDLIPELIRAIKDLNLTIIGADIGCLGGRMKSILLLYYKLDSTNGGVCNVSAIKQSLMGVLTRIISWSSASSTSNFRVTSKRQRFFFSS